MTGHIHNGSFWFDSLDTPPQSNAPGKLPQKVEVAIVGAGFTGLWTAYYLKQLEPNLEIAIFEANTVGFGASGRNGGWCMGNAMGIDEMLSRPNLRDKGIELSHAMHDTVDEIGRVCQAENIDCHFHKGGTLTVATTPFHADMLEQAAQELAEVGLDPGDNVWLPAQQAKARINLTPNHGALFTPHCAAIHPARLVRGLGEVVRELGVQIYEQTPVTRIGNRQIETPSGTVSANRVLRATEGYTDSIRGQERQLMPLYSMMVATEPLPEDVWDEIGLRDRETFGDLRRIVVYGQRTLDNRFAFGGRAGYYFRSKMKPVIDPDDPCFIGVEKSLRQFFPMLEPYAVTHRWGGLMGVPRNWRPFVTFDETTGFGAAGGYTGEGVAATNLAARILADLVCGRDTPLTQLAWVNDMPPKWEPEPFRWIGATGLQWFGDIADKRELATGKRSKFWGAVFAKFT